MIARKLTFLRKYRYFNSLSNATHPIQIHRAVLEKLAANNAILLININYMGVLSAGDEENSIRHLARMLDALASAHRRRGMAPARKSNFLALCRNILLRSRD